MERLSQLLERSELNSLPNRLHGVKVKVEVVDGIEGRGGHLANHI